MEQNSFNATAVDQLIKDIDNMIVQCKKDLEDEEASYEKECVLREFLARDSYKNLSLGMFGIDTEEKADFGREHGFRAAELNQRIMELKSLKEDIQRYKSYGDTMYAAE